MDLLGAEVGAGLMRRIPTGQQPRLRTWASQGQHSLVQLVLGLCLCWGGGEVILEATCWLL